MTFKLKLIIYYNIWMISTHPFWSSGVHLQDVNGKPLERLKERFVCVWVFDLCIWRTHSTTIVHGLECDALYLFTIAIAGFVISVCSALCVCICVRRWWLKAIECVPFFSSSFVCWVRASVHSNVSRCWQMKYRLINKPDNGMIWFVRIGMCNGMQEIYSLFPSCKRNKFNFGPLGKFILRKKLETIRKSGIKCIRMRRGGL